MHYELCIMNCFRAFRLSPSGFPPMYRRKILRLSLKDAAPIPNALGATNIKIPTSSKVNSNYMAPCLMEPPYLSFQDVYLDHRRRYARRKLSAPCL